jgi:hypothetical protein
MRVSLRRFRPSLNSSISDDASCGGASCVSCVNCDGGCCDANYDGSRRGPALDMSIGGAAIPNRSMGSLVHRSPRPAIFDRRVLRRIRSSRCSGPARGSLLPPSTRAPKSRIQGRPMGRVVYSWVSEGLFGSPILTQLSQEIFRGACAHAAARHPLSSPGAKTFRVANRNSK